MWHRRGCQYAISLAATAAVLVVLSVFPRIETWIDNLTHARTYEVVCHADDETLGEIESLFRANGLRVRRTSQAKSGDHLTCKWEVQGKPDEHEQLVRKLLAHADVLEFRT